MTAKVEKLKIWWTPAPPAKPFEVPVQTIEEGRNILNALVSYTWYLDGRGLLAPIDADAGGLEAYLDGEWVDAEFALGDDGAWDYDDGAWDYFEKVVED